MTQEQKALDFLANKMVLINLEIRKAGLAPAFATSGVTIELDGDDDVWTPADLCLRNRAASPRDAMCWQAADYIMEGKNAKVVFDDNGGRIVIGES